MIFAGTLGYLGDVHTFVGVVRGNYPDVCVIRRIRVRCGTIATKRQLLAIWRPSHFPIIVIARRNLCQAAFHEIKDVKMRAAAVQVADLVLLELAPVDDPRPLRLVLFLSLVPSPASESLSSCPAEVLFSSYDASRRAMPTGFHRETKASSSTSCGV